MNAYELFDSFDTMDSFDVKEDAVQYIKSYADEMFEIVVSDEIAQKIFDCV